VLDREKAIYTTELARGQRDSQLHYGGGSPTFLSDAELDRLMGSLRREFDIVPGAEISIEVDPRTVTPLRLAHCRQLGFNRVSFGVQDFDPVVQKAVHRVQSFEMVQELVQSARALGYHSINADLIYGLPKQTPTSFARTVEQIGEIRPDRIALYAYAHLPQRVKSQRHIAQADLPTAAERVEMLGGAIAGLLERGYDYIGMDHFALAGDSLAVAKRDGRMQRNFQGYSTQPDCDLIGLGVSAIARIGSTYQQNAKAIGDYYAAVRAGRLPVERGIGLDADDLLRRDVIMTLMCQGRLAFDSIERTYGVDFRAYFAAELEALAPYAAAGLVAIEPAVLRVSAAGWYVVRAIAMLFDRYLHDDQERSRFSRIL
jgi:oxygen-independent coproporphyrinogen-3 oxidase